MFMGANKVKIIRHFFTNIRNLMSLRKKTWCQTLHPDISAYPHASKQYHSQRYLDTQPFLWNSPRTTLH